jgi:hypothetical protein
MPQLFLYLIFALTAAAGGQNLQVDAGESLDHALSFVEQEVNTGWDQSSDGDGSDDYCFCYAQLSIFTPQFEYSYTLSVPSSHSSYRAYSARAPPVFLS